MSLVWHENGFRKHWIVVFNLELTWDNCQCLQTMSFLLAISKKWAFSSWSFSLIQMTIEGPSGVIIVRLISNHLTSFPLNYVAPSKTWFRKVNKSKSLWMKWIQCHHGWHKMWKMLVGWFHFLKLCWTRKCIAFVKWNNNALVPLFFWRIAQEKLFSKRPENEGKSRGATVLAKLSSFCLLANICFLVRASKKRSKGLPAYLIKDLFSKNSCRVPKASADLNI